MELKTLEHYRLPSYKYVIDKTYITLSSRESKSTLRISLEQLRSVNEHLDDVYTTTYQFNPRTLTIGGLTFYRTVDRKVYIQGNSSTVCIFECDLKEMIR